MKDSEKYGQITESCLELFRRYMQKGLHAHARLNNALSSLQISREEFALQSRYIHRGFYCPSPDLEYIVGNMRRGKIAERITSAKRLTNRYLFDKDGTLIAAETFYPNGSTKIEHIFYEDNIVYGVSYNAIDNALEISVEQYADNKIIAYLWAGCSYSPYKESISSVQMIYETYRYPSNTLLETDFYNIDIINGDTFCKHYRYRFILDRNGIVVPGSLSQIVTTTRDSSHNETAE